MKKYILILCLVPFSIFSQVGIGTTNPNADAMLDVESVDQGVLIPRLSLDQTTNAAPLSAHVAGMLVYNTATANDVVPGFYYNNGSIWVPVSSVKRIDDLLDGKSDVDGSNDGSSVFLGISAGQNDDSGHRQNVGVGYQALQVGATSSTNVAVGFQSMRNNIGNSNTAVGFRALIANDPNATNTGANNTAVGHVSLRDNTTGSNNAALGKHSLVNNETGSNNISVGAFTLSNNTSGSNNNAVGNNSMNANVTGDSNAAFGAFSLAHNLDGINNVAIGNQSLRYNVYGDSNVALGDYAGRSLDHNAASDVDNDNNVFIGGKAGYSDVDSARNVYIGFESGSGDYDAEDGSGTAENKSGNVFIGYRSGYNENGSDKLYIENSNSSTPLIYGEFDNDIVEINGSLKVADQQPFKVGKFTAGQAAGLTAENGDIIYLTSTNGTFTSIGFWGYENGSWVKL